MKNIPDKYINLISSVPYNVSNEYGLPYDVVINYIKKFRKNLNVNDFLEFIKLSDRYGSDTMYIDDKLILLDKVFGDLNFTLNDEQVLEISKSFTFTKYELFKDFMNIICDQMFIGDDVDQCRSVNNLLECRSYKIYLLLNSEEEIC